MDYTMRVPAAVIIAVVLGLCSGCSSLRVAISTDDHRLALDDAIVANAALASALEEAGGMPVAAKLAADVGATLNLLASGLVGGLPVERRRALDPVVAATIRVEVADAPPAPALLGLSEDQVKARLASVLKERDEARASAAAKDRVIEGFKLGASKLAVKAVSALGDAGAGSVTGGVLTLLLGLAWKNRKQAAGLFSYAMATQEVKHAREDGRDVDVAEAVVRHANANGAGGEVASAYERASGKRAKTRKPPGRIRKLAAASLARVRVGAVLRGKKKTN